MKKLSDFLNEKQVEMANIVRILTYKENPSVLQQIDFENDAIFLNPIFLAYFNKAQTDTFFPENLLIELYQGYLKSDDFNYEGLLDKNKTAYIPNQGYFSENNSKPLTFIKDTNLEVISEEIPLYKNIVHIVTSGIQIQTENISLEKDLFKKNYNTLEKVVHFIKKNSEEFYNEIEKVLRTFIFFQINQEDRNGKSFSSINANGAIFLHVNGKNTFSEILSDVIFTSSSLLFTTLFHGDKEIFEKNIRTNISELITTEDPRNFYTLFLNLFCNTVSAFYLLDSLSNLEISTEEKEFLNLKIAFYLKKANSDFETFQSILEKNISTEVLEKSAKESTVFSIIKAFYVTNKNNSILSNYNFTNFHHRTSFGEFKYQNNYVKDTI
ncbi:hypothetical protein [Aureivirga marina]|uniref:hypothetical protein n=1 Tax=Aureivirga marina TaxID=1182451 RepID=UPI0018CB39FD|nr:hypothetical protein [Aureivirga marina]